MERKRIEKIVALLLIGILMPVSLFPFRIDASVQSTIVPTFTSTTSQWNGHLYVTNFSDGTNNQASSTLSFTLDDDYYGVIYFDGYGPSSQHIANYASVFIAGGYGEYRYSYYQSGVINITSVTINIVNVVKPSSSVDLSQIVTLLTAIESDTTAIDNVLDTTLSQIRLVLAELIESNGYLDDLTKLRQWNFPVESFAINYYLMNQRQYEIVDLINMNYYLYPIYSIPENNLIDYRYVRNGLSYYFILGINQNVNNLSDLSTYFTVTSGDFSDLELIHVTNGFRIIKFKVINIVAGDFNIKAKVDLNLMAILSLRSDYYDNAYFSTDFALQYGLNNRLLNDLNIIANGTSQSSSASGSLDQTTSQFSDDANDLVTIEESFNNSMNQSLQSLNPTFNMGSSFLTSANWVSQQFNRIVNNTPFASLITFGLTLGLGLLIIGKVRK